MFSDLFEEDVAIYLKNRGVLIAFETGESPIHAPFLFTSQLIYVSGTKSITIFYIQKNFKSLLRFNAFNLNFNKIVQYYPNYLAKSLNKHVRI